jgi:hypothetical protein
MIERPVKVEQVASSKKDKGNKNQNRQPFWAFRPLILSFLFNAISPH